MSLNIKGFISLYSSTQSRLEKANLWSHIEKMVEDLAIKTYPNEYETSIYYDRDYEDSINAQREAFKKGYLSAIQELNLN